MNELAQFYDDSFIHSKTFYLYIAQLVCGSINLLVMINEYIAFLM